MKIIRSKIGTWLARITEALFLDQSVLTCHFMFCLLDGPEIES